MRRYYLQNKKEKTSRLKDLVTKNLKMSDEEALRLIVQGSVWDKDGKCRIKDPERIIKNQLIEVFAPDYPIVPYQMDADRIIYEDDWILVADKPGGVNCCPTPFSDTDCLLSGIRDYLQSKNIGHDPSPVNRLDKPTSGLVFFGKSKEAESALGKLFHYHQIRKLYLAVTDQFAGVKERYLISDILEWKGAAKNAVSYILFEGEYDGRYYFTVYPKTGRTHQIRKHFKEYLTPIIGDALYGNYSRDDEMLLICYLYRFKHPFLQKKITIRHLDKRFDCKF